MDFKEKPDNKDSLYMIIMYETKIEEDTFKRANELILNELKLIILEHNGLLESMNTMKD